MGQCVREYVGGCLICKRTQKPQPVRYLKNVLTKPLPLQMISCDLVGPRRVGGSEFHYLVIIDHASRFLVAKLCGLTADEVIKIIREYWITVFQVPNAILTDRGPAFRNEFQRFVTVELRAYHVYTSPYYPQGNAINEASHIALEKSIAAEVMIGGRNAETVLYNSVLVHNACPHSSTGISPFGFLFGFEPLLPGWQGLRNQNDEELRDVKKTELRQQRLLREQLMSQNPVVVKSVSMEVGDWVVYLLSNYEKMVTESKDSKMEYSPAWSLPAKVVEVKSEVVVVRPWGGKSGTRQVPLSQVQKLQGKVAPSLQPLTLKMLELAQPRSRRPLHLQSAGATGEKKEWKELLEGDGMETRKRMKPE